MASEEFNWLVSTLKKKITDIEATERRNSKLDKFIFVSLTIISYY